jgi:hypothetical protein
MYIRAGWTFNELPEFRETNKIQPVADSEYDTFQLVFENNEVLWNQIE